MNLEFKNLYFGKASAEKEASRNPEKFFRTYCDCWGLAETLQERDFFLVVGPKGAGKSAVAEYIRLTLENQIGQEKVIARTLMMDEVGPGITPLTQINKSFVSEQASYITDNAWRVFLSLRLFELLMRDQGSSLQKDQLAVKLSQELGRVGLLGSDFPDVLRREAYS